MDKVDVIVFASVCTICCYIFFFNKNNNNSIKKIDREIEEAIKKISDLSVSFKKWQL